MIPIRKHRVSVWKKKETIYNYVNLRMPDEAALSRSEVSDDYGIDLSDLEGNTTDTEAETEAETKNSGISEESATSEDSTTMEEEIESSGSYNTPEGVTISYNRNQIAITATERQAVRVLCGG